MLVHYNAGEHPLAHAARAVDETRGEHARDIACALVRGESRARHFHVVSDGPVEEEDFRGDAPVPAGADSDGEGEQKPGEEEEEEEAAAAADEMLTNVRFWHS